MSRVAPHTIKCSSVNIFSDKYIEVIKTMHHIRVLVTLLLLALVLSIVYTYDSNWAAQYPFLIGVLSNFMVLLIAKELKLFDVI